MRVKRSREPRKRAEKTTCEPTLSTHSFFLKKIQKRYQHWSPKMTPLGLGNHLLHTFWTLGLRAAQKVCSKLPREAPGTPNDPQRCQKGAKMEPRSEPKLEHSVKNNIKRLKEKQRNNNQTKRRKYKGKPSQPDLTSLPNSSLPASPAQPSRASQTSQHSTANTPQPTPREWGPAAGGVALKIFPILVPSPPG